MAFTPNEEQKAAIELRNMELLVSASAGAGKTGSLCRRIVDRLCDREHPAELGRILVVTFTRAAAAEMRTRIGKELREKITLLSRSQEEEDRLLAERLKEQLLLLPLARIGTIDSFCFDLIKANFEKLDISPSIRIADEVELKGVKEGIMRRATGRLSEKDPEGMGRLTDGLLTAYGDGDLPATLIGFYENTLAYPGGISCLKEASELARRDGALCYTESESGRTVKKKILADLDYYVAMYDRYLCGTEVVAALAKQNEVIGKERDVLVSLRETLKEDVVAFEREACGYEFPTLPPSRDKSPERAFFKRVRDGAKDFIKNSASHRLDYDLLDHQRQLAETGRQLDLYHELFSLYEKELSARKRRMGVLEFSDILLFAEKLLYDANGEKSAFAKELADDFDEIYIDEFQDVNDLQERVFAAISRGNRFLVGDVKQSIYGFRGACPDIFSKMREDFPVYTEKDEKGKLFLSYNYRSTPEVIAFVNAVCGRLLGLCSDMTYLPQDDLKAGKKDLTGTLPTVCLIGNSKKSPFLADEPNREAAYTARCIAGMIRNGREPSDIAVLVRSRGKSVSDLIAALEKEGVEVDAGQGSGFYQRPEILLVLALLEAVDNPTHDIALAAIMKSPVFGFTLDELVILRRASKSESLFSALTEYALETGDEKARRVLSFLVQMRAMARELTVEKLVWQLYDGLTLIPLLGIGQSKEEKALIGKGLLHFYDLAASYASACGGDLSSFLEYVEELSKSGRGEEGKSTEPVKGKVRIMTFHGSKGLQAPVCWLYGCGKRLELAGKSVPFDKTFGPGFLLVEEDGVLTSKSSFYHAIGVRAEEKGLNEELRLLYVALTRAESELYISGIATGKLLELRELAKQIVLKREHLEHFNTPCYLSFVLMALGGREDSCRILENEFPPELEERFERETERGSLTEHCFDISPSHENAPFEEPPVKEELVERYFKRLSFVYPFAESVNIPAKLAVSVLSPGVLDGENGEEDPEKVRPSLQEERPEPAFYTPEKQKASGAKIGSATHAFMQFCDFEAVERKGVKAEICRLEEGLFLDRKSAELVDEKAVEGFFRSDLYAALKEAQKVYREQRFLFELPAGELTEDPERKEALAEETVLVQGVIDCFFISKEGRVVLFDYKTDRFTAEEKKDKEHCRKVLAKRHKRQLGYYKAAVEGLLSRPVDEVLLYSFSLGETVTLF